jgi:hypothetical protein
MTTRQQSGEADIGASLFHKLVIVDSLIDIFEDLENAAHAMVALCVSGLEWNGVRRQDSLDHAVDRWIVFATASGYDEATRKASS